MSRISVIIPTNRPPDTVAPCLQALAPPGHRPAPPGSLPHLQRPARRPRLPRRGLAVPLDRRLHSGRSHRRRQERRPSPARRATGSSSSTTMFSPPPGCVSAHLAAHAQVGQPALVLGAAEWRRHPDDTLFDHMIRDTSLVFFYDRMRPHAWYNYRHAWNLNLSVRRTCLDSMAFDERLGPFFFEDLELAWRLERQQNVRVWYAPEAQVLHDHRYTFETYLEREFALGRAAVRLWQCNPACFRDTYRLVLDQRYLDYCRQYLTLDCSRALESQARLTHILDRARCGIHGTAIASRCGSESLHRAPSLEAAGISARCPDRNEAEKPVLSGCEAKCTVIGLFDLSANPRVPARAGRHCGYKARSDLQRSVCA